MQFSQLENILENEGIVFLSYGGSMTQPLIAGMTDALEKEVKSNNLNMNISNNIFTIFIELSQNMMNYANLHSEITEGDLIIVGMTPDGKSYYIISRNKVDNEAKNIINEHLNDIEKLDKEELRALYRERRRRKKDSNSNGAGIGFIEIARKCDHIEHSFKEISDGRYYFTAKAIINK